MYTVNVSIKTVKESGSNGNNLTEQPRLVLSFLRNLTVCNQTEALWVKRALCLPWGSQWLPGSIQQNLLDNLGSSHMIGLHMGIRGEHVEFLVSLLKASFLQIGVKTSFKRCLVVLKLLGKKSVVELGSSRAVTWIKHAEWAMFYTADMFCSLLSACLSLQVTRAECVLPFFTLVFLCWLLSHAAFVTMARPILAVPSRAVSCRGQRLRSWVTSAAVGCSGN